ncbi:MAG: hypothetical protein H6707_06290 [Deltaproteobacteria bacterium]|nr:hypothetical protein [Deltaproteobacteria bacterium]
MVVSKQKTFIILVASLITCDAWANAERNVAIGVGVHATVHRNNGAFEGEAATGGAQLRVKFFRYIGLRFDYDFARQRAVSFEDVTQAAQLVAYPDLRLALGIHPVPNRWCSPYLALGMGINTGTGFDEPSLLGGVGLETTFLNRFVVGVGGQVFYPTPGRIKDFILRMADQEGFELSAKDFIKPAAWQLNFELTVYL